MSFCSVVRLPCILGVEDLAEWLSVLQPLCKKVTVRNSKSLRQVACLEEIKMGTFWGSRLAGFVTPWSLEYQTKRVSGLNAVKYVTPNEGLEALWSCEDDLGACDWLFKGCGAQKVVLPDTPR